MKRVFKTKNIVLMAIGLIITIANITLSVLFNNTYSIIMNLLNTTIFIFIIISIIQIYKENKDENFIEFKSHILSNISHELKTPLNGITGMTTLLKESKLTDQQKEYLDVLGNCSESLITQINDIIDLTKLENNELIIENIEFDLRKMLRDFYTMNHFSAELKDLTFNIEIDPELSSYFRGDPGRIRQMISNLYNNAVKFTSKGSVKLECKNLSENEKTTLIRFLMKDSGIGMNDKELKTVFKNFKQSDSSKSKRYQGIGLGLSICRNIINLMGGEIGVKSSPGVGTEFWFDLELERCEMLRIPRAKSEIKGIKSLLICSNEFDFEDITEKMHLEEVNTTLCKNESEAEEILKSESFDLIVFNLRSNFVKQIPEIVNSSNTRFLAMASEGLRGDGNLCRNLGINGYLSPPFSGSTVTDILPIILSTERGDDLITKHSISEDKKSRIKILTVDDNKVNLLIAEKMLQKLGYNCDTAISGEVCIEMLKNESYNLIFMDLQMPGINGLQATDMIRNEKAGYINRNVPIVALTANTTETDRLSCSMVGMDGFLTKPYNPVEIEKTINRFIK